MSKFVKIISSDQKFAKMIALELSEIGIEQREAVEDEDNNKYFVVVDVDSITLEELEGYASKATVIGLTKSPQKHHSAKADICSAFFVRPFLMSDFLTVFGKSGSIMPQNTKAKHTESHRKPYFLTVDRNSSSAVWGEMKIPLSDNEFKLLTLLCENRGDIVERERIYSLLGADEGNMGDVYICHLRRKIDNKLGLKLIYTIRGKGYMLKN